MGDKTEITGQLIAGCVVVFAALLAYSNTFTNGFVWDDASSVLIHQDVQDPSRVLELFKYDQHRFGQGQGNFYRPLVSVSFMIDYALAGGQSRSVSPFLFHVTNLAWHALASVLLMIVLGRMGAVLPIAAAVSTVYAVHPLHTEAVTYISGRADSMAAAFIFAALAFALANTAGQMRIITVAASAVMFAAGLLCKESALIYTPLLVLCASVAPVGADESPGAVARMKARIIPIGLGAVITGVYAVLRSTVLSFGSDSAPRSISFAEHMGEVFGAFALYLKLVVMPTGLHMERVLDAQPLWQIFVGMLLLGAVCGMAIMAARAGRTRIAAGLGWFLLTWLPISGLFPLNAPMAEHWLYVPLGGLLWAAAEIIWPFVNRGMALRVAAIGTAVLVFVFIGVSVDRNRDWRNNETIYAATLDQNPDTIRVNYNLAVTYEDIVDNGPGARRHFARVLELYEQKRAAEGTPEGTYWPDEQDSRLSLGRSYLGEARFDLAFAQFMPLVQSAASVSAADVAARAAMGVAICYVGTSQSPRAAELVQRIAETEQLPAVTAYYRRTFAANKRIADQMQSILLRVNAQQRVQQLDTTTEPAEAQPLN